MAALRSVCRKDMSLGAIVKRLKREVARARLVFNITYFCSLFAVFAVGFIFGADRFEAIAKERFGTFSTSDSARQKPVAAADVGSDEQKEAVKLTLCVPVSMPQGQVVGGWLDAFRMLPADIRLYGVGDRELALALVLKSALLRNETSGKILISHLMSAPVLERDPGRLMAEMSSSAETRETALELRDIAAKKETQEMIVKDAKWGAEHVGDIATFAVFIGGQRVPDNYLHRPQEFLSRLNGLALHAGGLGNVNFAKIAED